MEKNKNRIQSISSWIIVAYGMWWYGHLDTWLDNIMRTYVCGWQPLTSPHDYKNAKNVFYFLYSIVLFIFNNNNDGSCRDIKDSSKRRIETIRFHKICVFVTGNVRKQLIITLPYYNMCVVFIHLMYTISDSFFILLLVSPW